MREIARERARKRTSGHQRTAIEAHLLSRKFIAHAASELRRPLSDRARQWKRANLSWIRRLLVYWARSNLGHRNRVCVVDRRRQCGR